MVNPTRKFQRKKMIDALNEIGDGLEATQNRLEQDLARIEAQSSSRRKMQRDTKPTDSP